MTYQEDFDKAMSLIQPMDIIATRDKSIISWYLRMKTNSDFSHVCLAGPRGLVFTTTATKYRLSNAKDYLQGKSFSVWRHDDITVDKRELGLNYNFDLIDTPYAYKDIFAMITFNLSGRDVKHMNTTDQKNVFCAESVDATYRAMDLRLLTKLNLQTWQMTPQRCIEDAKINLIYEVNR